MPDGPNGSDPNDGPFAKLSADSSASSVFCFRRYASGRPIIVDMTIIDARVGAEFQVFPGGVGGAGLLVLEDRKTAVFVADPTDPQTGAMLNPLPPFEIASGKTGWNLDGNESVQSVTMLQLDCAPTACTSGADKKVNYLLVTTSTGKVIAKRTDPLAAATTAFPAAATCGSTASPQFWVRVSPQSGRVYLSDRGCNVVRQLGVTNAAPALSQLSQLSTAPATASLIDTSNALNTLSVSPGIGFDLNDCYADDCVLVPDDITDLNDVGAKITSVVIDQRTGQSGLTVFRITGIPDCRNFAPNPAPVICNGAVVSVNGVPGFLDVAKLLPLEVKSLFNDSTTPTLASLTLLISPQYRARPPCVSTNPDTPLGCTSTGPGNTFEAFFGRTEDNATGASVVFRNTFALKFDIGQLNGTQTSRCGFLNTDPLRRTPAEWDIITTVSERYRTASIVANGAQSGFSTALNNTDMLVNTFCENPTSGSGGRWSLYAYGLMLADTTPDAFATLVDGLYDELERARVLTACTNYAGDGNANQPLSPAICSGLAADWANGRDKLTKCIGATLYPKTSAVDQNCQAFVTQFNGYRNRLATADVGWWSPPAGVVPDKANRLGELKARTAVILHVYNDQFLPSIPPGGFAPQ